VLGLAVIFPGHCPPPSRACRRALARRPLPAAHSCAGFPPPPVPPLSAHRWTSSSVPWPLSLRRAPPSAPCARVKTAALGAAPSLPGVRFAAGWYVCSRITITHHRWPTRTPGLQLDTAPGMGHDSSWGLFVRNERKKVFGFSIFFAWGPIRSRIGFSCVKVKVPGVGARAGKRRVRAARGAAAGATGDTLRAVGRVAATPPRVSHCRAAGRTLGPSVFGGGRQAPATNTRLDHTEAGERALFEAPV